MANKSIQLLLMLFFIGGGIITNLNAQEVYKLSADQAMEMALKKQLSLENLRIDK